MFVAGYLNKSAPNWGDLDFLRNRRTSEKFQLTHKIASIWSTIGSRLGIEPDLLDSMMDDFRNNEGRLRHVLNTWLTHASGLPNYDVYPVSWQGLHNLLAESGKEEVANDYFQFLYEITYS